LPTDDRPVQHALKDPARVLRWRFGRHAPSLGGIGGPPPTSRARMRGGEGNSGCSSASVDVCRRFGRGGTLGVQLLADRGRGKWTSS
jgi:hypothetical protein